MAAMPPHPDRPAPPPPPALIPTRTTSLPKSKQDRKSTTMTTLANLTPTRTQSQSSRDTYDPSLKKHPFSAPPTWRAKFPSLRRSHSKLSDTTTTATTATANNPYKRCSASSTTSVRSAHSNTSDISLASSTVEYGKAEIVEFVRAPKPKLVDARSPMTTFPPRKESKKLLEYYGVRQGDRDVVALQRSSGERVSAFREEFDSPEGRKRAGSDATVIRHGRERDKELPSPPIKEVSAEKEGKVWSEGLVKWFRCDIYPSNEADFCAAEAAAKGLVIDGGGTVMSAWMYPGGFMFQVPRNLPSPLPPTIPSATPTLAATILSAYLGETGSLRVTEFQPHLDPMQHLLQQTNLTHSSSTTLAGDGAGSGEEDLVSAIEYLTTPSLHPSPLRSHPPSLSVEEIPLLRTSPSKSKPNCRPSSASTFHSPNALDRKNWHDSMHLSAPAKAHLHTWLLEQQHACTCDPKMTTKKRRDGQVYGASGRRGLSGLVQIEEVNEEDVVGRADAGEWVSEDEAGEDADDEDEGSGSGSEFSVATGLESVRFVAEFGSLF